jgi:hypothetical protein
MSVSGCKNNNKAVLGVEAKAKSVTSIFTLLSELVAATYFDMIGIDIFEISPMLLLPFSILKS